MRIKIKNKDLKGLILILFFALCVYNPSGFIYVPGYITRAIFLAVATVALFLLYRGNNIDEKIFFRKCVFKLILIPDIVLFMYSILITLVNNDEYPILSSTISMFIDRVLMVLFIWACVKNFGYKAIDYFFWGCTISYCYTLIIYFIQYGIVTGIQQATVGSYGLSIEVHNMTYIFGYMFLYFLLMAPKKQKRSNLIKAIFCIIFVYFGQKRMIFLSVGIALIFWVLLFKWKEQARKQIIRFGCGLSIIISLLYVWCISSGVFERLILLFGIETSSRLRFYTYFAGDYSFSPFFWGKGITYTDEIMASVKGIRDLNLPAATTIHNDILRLFIGVGMLPLLMYLINVIYLRVKQIQRYFKGNTAFKYFVLSMAYFVNWFASNAGMEMWCFSGYIFCMLTLLHNDWICE